MLDTEIIEENPVSKYEIKEFIDLVKKRDKDVSERLIKTLESFHLTEKLDYKKIQKDIEKLEIPRLKKRHIVKIIDIMPQDMESLNALFVGENITLNHDSLQKMLVAIKKKDE